MAYRKYFVLLLFMGMFGLPAIAEESHYFQQEEIGENAEYQKNLGAYYWQQGDYGSAVSAWQKELERSDSPLEKTAISLKIARARINLNQSKIAIIELQELVEKVIEPDLQAEVQNELGNAFYLSNDFENAYSAYKASIDIRENLPALNNLMITRHKQASYASLQAENSKAEISNSYKNLAQKYSEEALEYGLIALSKSQKQNSFSSLKTLIQWQKISSKRLTSSQLYRGREILESLPSSREKRFLMLEWARVDPQRKALLFSEALTNSQTVNDSSLQSYIFLEMGLEAEKNQDYIEALNLADRAQTKARESSMVESLYRSFLLAGRIYKRLDKRELALENYSNAIFLLEEHSTPKSSMESRLEFSKNTEPVYRQMLELLLFENNPSKSRLKEAISIFDKLRLAQLQRYFGDDCLEINSKIITVEENLRNKNAVVIYSIILQEQTHFILQTKEGNYYHHKVKVSKAEINDTAKKWYGSLKRADGFEYKKGSRYFYNAIARPFEHQLETVAPSVVIFVHDGILRNVPMAAMLDEETFFVQKYPSISSIGYNIRPIENNKLIKLTAFGLYDTEIGVEGWSKLDKAMEEVNNIVKIIEGKKFVNDEFTVNNLQKQVNKQKNKNYNILHLATHGYFGGIAENSFILSYDKIIDALFLEQILKSSEISINFLVLSACETSIGNDLSTLGLAGIALRSGVDSVLGTLWAVQDVQQSEFVESFYRHLSQHDLVERAVALQKTQIEFVERKYEPNIWAGANLIE